MKLGMQLIAMILLLGVAQAQTSICYDARGKEVPGYVKADCSNEEARFAQLSCGVSNTTSGTTISYSSGGQTQTAPVTAVNGSGSAACAAIQKDLAACKSQCVPKVTNGRILPGPKDGSTARNYLLGNFLPNLTNSFLIFNMVVGVIFMIVAGVMFIMASGNPDLTARARDTMVWAIIGLTIGVLAYVAVQLVININFFA